MAKVGTPEWTDKYLSLKTKATLAQTKYEAYLENLDSATFQAHDVDIQDAIRKRGEHLGPQATSTWTQLQPLLTDAEFLRMQLSPLSNILLSDTTAADKLRRFSAEGNFFGIVETINASLRFSSLEIHAVDALMKEMRQNSDTSLTIFGARFMRMVDIRNSHTETALTQVGKVSLFMDLLNDAGKFYLQRVRGFRNSSREAALDTLDVPEIVQILNHEHQGNPRETRNQTPPESNHTDDAGTQGSTDTTSRNQGCTHCVAAGRTKGSQYHRSETCWIMFPALRPQKSGTVAAPRQCQATPVVNPVPAPAASPAPVAQAPGAPAAAAPANHGHLTCTRCNEPGHIARLCQANHNPAWPANGFPQARTTLAAIMHLPVADPQLLLHRPPTLADTGCNKTIMHSASQVTNAVAVPPQVVNGAVAGSQMLVTHAGNWTLPGTALTIPALVCPSSTRNLVAVLDIMDLDPSFRADIAPAPAGQHSFLIRDAADKIIFSALENNGLLELDGPARDVSIIGTAASAVVLPISLVPVSPRPDPISQPGVATISIEDVATLTNASTEHAFFCVAVEAGLLAPATSEAHTSRLCNHGEQHEKFATFWELHSRWGHPCLKDFKLMAANKYIAGAPVRFDIPDVELPCAVCLVAKGLATRIARQPAAHRSASRRGEVLQFDGYGRISFAGLPNDLHELTICTDKFTGYEIGVPLQFKSQAANAQLSILRRVHRMVATEGGVDRIERDPGTDIVLVYLTTGDDS